MRTWTWLLRYGAAVLASVFSIGLLSGGPEIRDALAPEPPQAPRDQPRVLVFSKTTGFRHASIPAGIASYGAGTPGCGGVMAASAGSSATVGNASFGFTCTNAPRHTLGFALVGDVAELAGTDLFSLGLTLHVDLLFSSAILARDFVSDAGGNAFAAAPIPPVPGYAGATLYAQAIWIGTAATGELCSAAVPGLESSTGASMTILP